MLNFDGDIDIDTNADVKCEHSIRTLRNFYFISNFKIEMFSVLRSFCVDQVYEELKHPHDLNCVLYWRGHTTDVFVTYFPNSLFVWSIYLLATGQLEIKSHGWVP